MGVTEGQFSGAITSLRDIYPGDMAVRARVDAVSTTMHEMWEELKSLRELMPLEDGWYKVKELGGGWQVVWRDEESKKFHYTDRANNVIDFAIDTDLRPIRMMEVE